jgi:hypothetical protein
MRFLVVERHEAPVRAKGVKSLSLTSLLRGYSM